MSQLSLDFIAQDPFKLEWSTEFKDVTFDVDSWPQVPGRVTRRAYVELREVEHIKKTRRTAERTILFQVARYCTLPIEDGELYPEVVEIFGVGEKKRAVKFYALQVAHVINYDKVIARERVSTFKNAKLEDIDVCPFCWYGVWEVTKDTKDVSCYSCGKRFIYRG